MGSLPCCATRYTFETQGMNKEETKIEIQNLTMAYGSYVVMRDISAGVKRGSIFVIMGNSGSGKSTLLRHMIGLQRPVQGDVLYDGTRFWGMDDEARRDQLRKYGVLFQSGALWSSMTLAENVALALVGLNGFEDYYPAEISGGMRKRAGLARAMALDPEILFFDEPSAGLDPISSRMLDDLILELRDSLGATIAVVTHELASIFAIGNNSVFLDADTKTMIAQGDPKKLRDECPDPKVRNFLLRGELDAKAKSSAGDTVSR